MNNRIPQIPEAIRMEALRCLYCVEAPCQQGCPAGIDIAQFIRHLKTEDLTSAKRVIKSANPLGGVCAYLCPSAELCQEQCTRGRLEEPVHIRELQKYICDNAEYALPQVEPCGKKVCVVGAGPAGISCAAALAKKGVDVDIFEQNQGPGGLVSGEIPQYRVAMEAVEKDLEELRSERIRFRYGQRVDGRMLEKLSAGYDAVFLGVGLEKDRESGFPLSGKVTTAARFLSEAKNGGISRVDGDVYVVGGGDSAVDAAETALRLGAGRSVLTYRRGRREMPATDETLVDAMLEGMEILYNTTLSGIGEQDGRLALRFVQNCLLEAKDGGRRGFAPVPGSEYTLMGDLVVFALGKTAGDAFSGLGGLEESSLRLGGGNVYAGGDFTNGGATVVEAVCQGKLAAENILRQIV